MKNTLVITLVVLLLAGIACAGTSTLPTANVAPERLAQATSSNRAALRPGEGSPMPLCPPGQNCSGLLRQGAGEGSPAEMEVRLTKMTG